VSRPATFGTTMVALGIATLAAGGSGPTHVLAERSTIAFHHLQRVSRQRSRRRPPTTTSITIPTKVLHPGERFCQSAGANPTPATPNPHEPKRIGIEAVDGGSRSVDAERCVLVWLTCPVPAICGGAVVPVIPGDRCVESGIGGSDLGVNGDQTALCRDRRPADRHSRRRVAHDVALNPHEPPILCSDGPPTVLVIAATSPIGTCSEVPQMAPRCAQFTESPGRYRPHDAHWLNQNAHGRLEVRAA
jgi:hypothetical protein